MLEQTLEQDLKTALLAHDKLKITTLRSLKSALLNQKIALSKRDSGLTDEEVITVLKKEAKQRQESADIYKQGGNEAKAEAELGEKAIIGSYLPAPMDEAKLDQIVTEVVAASPDKSIRAMGQIIAQVKDRTAGAADGGQIARLVKEKLS